MAKYDGINFTPPKSVQEEAQQGLDYRDEYGRGGTDVGIARARDLSNGKDMSPETIGRMVNFFGRHRQNRDPDKREPDGGPTNGWIAWLLWGGDSGDTWSSKVYEQMQRADSPTKNAEADRRQFLIFSWGEVAHGNGDFEVDEAFFNDMKECFIDLRADQYFPPILEMHGTGKGFNYGRWLDIFATEDGIEALVEFAAGMADAYDAGYLDSWSPSFWGEWEHPTNGKTYRFAPRELSFVDVKHLKNVPGASPHYSTYALRDEDCDWVPTTKLMEDTMSETPEARPAEVENAEGEDQPEIDMAELMSRIEQLEARCDKMEDGMKPEDEEEEGGADMGEASENSEFKALKAKVARMEAEAAIVDELGCTRVEAKELAEYKLSNPKAYNKIIALRAENSKLKAQPTTLSEVGTTGAAPRDGRVTYADAVKLAEEAGYKEAGPERFQWIAKHYPDAVSAG